WRTVRERGTFARQGHQNRYFGRAWAGKISTRTTHLPTQRKGHANQGAETSGPDSTNQAALAGAVSWAPPHNSGGSSSPAQASGVPYPAKSDIRRLVVSDSIPRRQPDRTTSPLSLFPVGLIPIKWSGHQ